MANFYKMDPAVWDAKTATLSLEEEAACLRICNANYKAERGCPDHPPMLAGMFRCSTRKARSLVQSLVEKGKIERRDDGLWSDRAASEILKMKKRGDEKEPNQPRNGNEPEPKESRNGDETPAKHPRNGDEHSDKPLKSAELSNGNTPPRLDKTRPEESRKDQLENAFEEFWKSYPRRRQECGSLSRGSKKAALDQFKKLSASERELAVKGLPGFKTLYPDDSKAVCDAERYFTKKRWLDVEGIYDAPEEYIPFPDGALGEKVRELDTVLGRDRFKSYFVRDGECTISEDENGIVISILGQFHGEQIQAKCMGGLRKVFGRQELRFETNPKGAARIPPHAA